MAYSDFTSLQKLQHELDISHQRNDLFSQIKSVTPSAKLQDDLEESRQCSLLTEKAKSEFLITPVLKEVHRTHPDKVGIFSGVSLDLPEAGLGGFCDFILSHESNTVELTAPIFCLVEAKNRTLEEGFAQCAAEMYAAMLFNQENNTPLNFMYGCVTNAYDWHFMRLENKQLQIDNSRFFLNEIDKILGIFSFIVSSYEE
ncbi:Uncharacterised protein [Candidatus Venteria ishoeyi]|uniref:Uncharacterized protein n=3 Tax=Candidatus Venteria ishoeyi TaxID=1899563 RepID=A0A1H6F695_9GAMM|nr:Uncharacterised protein [Candidatus Venteria ishoeyi]